MLTVEKPKDILELLGAGKYMYVISFKFWTCTYKGVRFEFNKTLLN